MTQRFTPFPAARNILAQDHSTAVSDRGVGRTGADAWPTERTPAALHGALTHAADARHPAGPHRTPDLCPVAVRRVRAGQLQRIDRVIGDAPSVATAMTPPPVVPARHQAARPPIEDQYEEPERWDGLS